MGELTTIGFMPGRSPLHRLDPRTKQMLVIFLGGVAAAGGIGYLGTLSILMVVLGRAAGLSLGRLFRETRYFLVFLLFVFLLRCLTFPAGWMPAIQYDAAVAAAIICWRLLVVVGMGLLLMATTRIAHIRAALVWFLDPVPLIDARMAATMVGLVVRFLPLILFQATEIADAQRARGIERRRNPLARLKWFTLPLFRRVFLGADELTAAMQARCYTDRRTLPDLRFTRRDGVAMGAALLLSATVFLP